jgi:hypothetical protein
MTVLLDKRTNIRESSTRAFRESGVTGARREIVIIEAGWGSSGYYSEKLIERDVPRIFPVGTHMYLNHPTYKEDAERPERDLRDLVGTIVEAPRMAGIASVAVANIFEHWLEVFSDEAFLEAIGLSIRAFGVAEEGDAGGKHGQIIQTLTEGLSIDYVTMAGAGGKIGPLVESVRSRVVPLIESARQDPRQAKAIEALASDIREELAEVGTETWGDENTYVYVEDFDVDEEWAIFWINPDDEAGYYYKINFTRDANNEITLEGDPETVERETNYVPATESAPSGDAAALLEEARNAGNWLEAGIHRYFTERTDNLFGEGYLSREERITLSRCIGSALEAFSSQLEEEAPQLYERDPYEDFGEAEDQYISETKCGSGRPNEGDSMTEEERKRLSESEARVRELERDNETLKEENGTLKARTERAEEANLRNEASLTAAEAIGSPEGLSPKGIARAVRECLSKEIPTHSDGTLDRGLVEERARAAARAELEYIGASTEGGGRVNGVGALRQESQLPGGKANGGGEATEDELTEAFKDIGMPEGVAKLAARGR